MIIFFTSLDLVLLRNTGVIAKKIKKQIVQKLNKISDLFNWLWKKVNPIILQNHFFNVWNYVFLNLILKLAQFNSLFPGFSAAPLEKIYNRPLLTKYSDIKGAEIGSYANFSHSFVH